MDPQLQTLNNNTKNKPIKAYGINFNPKIPLLACRVLKLVLETYRRFTANANSHIKIFHQNLKLPLRRLAYICSFYIDNEVCSFPYNKTLFNDSAEYDIFQLFLQWESCDTAIINYFKNSTALVGVWVGITFIASASVILYTCWEFFKAYREIKTNTVFLDKQFYAYCYSMGYLGVTVLTLFGIGVDLVVIGHTALILVLSVINIVIWVLFLLIVLDLYLWKRKY